jgi:transposase InsO family protein
MADRVVPVDVRNVIVTWSEDAPRGAVSKFCREHGVSRSQFYDIWTRAKTEGPVAAMLPRPRPVPVRHRQAVPLEIEELAVRIRKDLIDDGWDGGPVTVRHKLADLGVAAPAASTLARIFSRRGMVTPQPQKRPKTNWRRFEAGCVHECWQLDGFEWRLADKSVFTILQLTDDKSRHPIATRACPGERAVDAMAVVATGIERFQVPCRLLTDNGSAFNQDRLGRRTQLVGWLQRLGCRPITGAPAHPQTQGKNERAHQTLQRWLAARPAPTDLTEAQALLDQFDAQFAIRRHQGLRMRTPAEVLAEGPIAIAPLPPPAAPVRAPATVACQRVIDATGAIAAWAIRINIDYQRRGQAVTAVRSGTVISIFDQHGTHIRTIQLEHGRTYYGNNKPRGPKPKQVSGLA